MSAPAPGQVWESKFQTGIFVTVIDVANLMVRLRAHRTITMGLPKFLRCYRFCFEGTTGTADEPTANQASDAEAQRGSSLNTGEAADSPDSPRAAASPTFSDPGDGYDSAIRHHADMERGNL